MVAQQEASLGVMIKGKRTKRPRPSSPVLTLANDEGDSSVEWVGPTTQSTQEEEDMAQCLILLAQGFKPNNNNNKGTNITSSYECKTCNKSFSSFQALGGHRASHKKPKLVLEPNLLAKKSPVFFSLLDGDHHFNEEEIGLSLQIANRTTTSNNSNKITKIKVHECGICGAEFSSGQALGGHMRRHRPIGGIPTSNLQNAPIINTISTNYIGHDQDKTKNFLSLDLNLPAPEDENHHQQQQHRDPSYIFSSKEKTLVFSTSNSLVDCHY